MRVSSLLRVATLALALTGSVGAMTATFVSDAHAAQQQAANSSSPYDSSDFVAPLNDTY
ncbi:MAG TPA: hypothetical protein VGF92_17150 [Stellaceae bacterium]|jgi:hypothetical protein